MLENSLTFNMIIKTKTQQADDFYTIKEAL